MSVDVSGEPEGGLRLAVLYSHPTQYGGPLMRALAAQPGVDLTVYFCSRQGVDMTFDPQFGVSFQWDRPLLDGYRSVFLKNLRGEQSGVRGLLSLVNPGVFPALRRGRYDAIVVHGYEHATKWFAFAGAFVSGTDVILRGESQLLNRRPLLTRVAKQLVLRPLLRRMSAAGYIGARNRDFYRYYGMDDLRLFSTPYAVDNAFFAQEDARLRPARAELRARLGVNDDRPIILACGKLIEKKAPLLLLDAYSRVRERGQDCALVYAGDGPLRGEIERCVRERGIEGVTITGFLNQAQIGEAYVSADILALPSSNEPWGLVVNEAMNFGLPIVASDRVGSAEDLVRPGLNGVVVNHSSIDSLTAALEELVVDREQRLKLGEGSRRLIADYSLERVAATIAAAARQSRGRDHSCL